MRKEMINSQPFAAGIFIGGMDGLKEEWDLFQQTHPHVPAFPVASTGGERATALDELDAPPTSPASPPTSMIGSTATWIIVS